VLAPRMIAPRAIARSDHEHRARGVSLVLACAAVDALAAGILLVGAPLPSSFEVLAVVALHATAVLLLSGVARGRPSRRWLCIAGVLVVPCVGAAAAAVTLVTRGRGSAAVGRRRMTRRRPGLTKAAVHRLGGALSLCDALEGGDEEQRRAALSALSRRSDSEAIASLRRAAAGSDPDLALSAALALDEIGERAEREVERLDPAEVQRVAG